MCKMAWATISTWLILTSQIECVFASINYGFYEKGNDILHVEMIFGASGVTTSHFFEFQKTSAQLLATSETICRIYADEAGLVLHDIISFAFVTGVVDTLRQILAVHLNTSCIPLGNFSDDFQSRLRHSPDFSINRSPCSIANLGMEHECVEPTFHLGNSFTCQTEYSC